ncbi:hypothetical protein BH23VER1_BH23VER1_06330 [soil metagenome]
MPSPMKTSSTTHRIRSGGGILLVALVVLAAGGAGLAAFLSVLGGRVVYTEEQEGNARGRVVLSNSAAMAREYIYRNVLTEASGVAFVSPSVLASATDPNDVWGTFSMGEIGNPPLASEARPPLNRFSPANNDLGYFVSLPVTLGDGNYSYTPQFGAHSRSPLLAGDPLVVGRSAHSPSYSVKIATGTSNSDYLEVEGRSLYFNPGMNSHIHRELTPAYSTSNVAVPFAPSHPTSGLAIHTNFPSVPMTAGRSGTNLGYDGTIDVIDNASNPGSLVTKINRHPYSAGLTTVTATALANGDPWVSNGVRETGTTNNWIEINLSAPNLRTVYVQSGVTRIDFVGQTTAQQKADAAGLAAVMVVVSQAAHNLTNVTMSGENQRRLFVAVKNPAFNTLMDWSFTSATDLSSPAQRLEFRLLLVTERTRVDFSFPGDAADVHLYGGVHTDLEIIVSNATEKLFLHPQPIVINAGDPSFQSAALAERYADRVVWIESFIH